MIELCNTAQSMAAAAEEMEMAPNTFRRHAMKLGCYKPNQAGIGVVKSPRKDGVATEDILDGNVPYASTNRLKRRLLNEGYFTNECVECGIYNFFKIFERLIDMTQETGFTQNYYICKRTCEAAVRSPHSSACGWLRTFANMVILC